MKKAFKITKNIIIWLISALAVFMMIFTVISVTTLGRSDRNIFGYKAFIVLSDSMSATDFDAGDVVLVSEIEPKTLQVGDIIAYTSQNTSNYGETVTHKIRSITTDDSGEPGFITYGTTTDTDDETIVKYPFILGKYQSHIPNVGTFFQFLKTTPGYIIFILIPFLLLILFEGLRCIELFRRYKREQMTEINEEKLRIEEERARSAELLKELQDLKEQLASKKSVTTGQAEPN